MPRVLIVDDHALMRRGVRALLLDFPLRCEIGEATTGAEALDILRRESWDVVILDLSLPDRSGLEMLRDIKAQYPALPVLVLSVHDEVDYALRAFRSGASAYVPKSSAPHQLISAMSRALDGKRYFPPELAEQLAEELVSDKTTLHDRLSNRELDVMRQIASGKSNAEIGETLFISIKTVSTHRSNILRKLSLQNNSELILYAIRNGLVRS